MKIYNFTFVFILFFVACGPKATHIVKTEYYQNGNISSRISYINDTLKDGEAEFYDEQGNMTVKGYFLQGESDSVLIEYYPDGRISKYAVLYGPYQVSIDEYYRNGSVKKYHACRSNHKTLYKIEYDSVRGKILEEGHVISNEIAIDTIKPWHVGDSVDLTLFIAHPADYTSNVFFGSYKVGNISDTAVFYATHSKKIVQPFKEYKIDRVFAYYSLLFKEKGIYQSIFAGELIDLKTGFRKRDTISRVWKVE